jgi:hypothetical protein
LKKSDSQTFVKSNLIERIETLTGSVILLTDLADIAEERELLCGLEELVSDEKLAQIGKNVFAKVRLNQITGETMLDSDAGFDGVAKEALDRLGILWKPCVAERMYQDGNEQIPTRSVVRVIGDDRRPVISFKGHRLLYE